MRVRHADYVIDMGPGAGVHGGHIVAHGKLETCSPATDSLTADYLTGRRSVRSRRAAEGTGKSSLCTAPPEQSQVGHRVDPIGTFTCRQPEYPARQVGASTIDTLYAAAARHLNGARIQAGRHEKVTGVDYLDKVIDIDQSRSAAPRAPIGHLYGAFTRSATGRRPARKPGARLQAGRFSFNVKGAAARPARATA